MAIDEQRVRQSLHARLADTLGADEAALLMDSLPRRLVRRRHQRDVDALASASTTSIRRIRRASSPFG